MNQAQNPDIIDRAQAIPHWKCHKIVRASRITAIDRTNDTAIARLALDCGVELRMTHQWLVEKKAEAGGYLVLYADGYVSFSPAKAFVEGYHQLNPPGVHVLAIKTDTDAVEQAMILLSNAMPSQEHDEDGKHAWGAKCMDWMSWYAAFADRHNKIVGGSVIRSSKPRGRPNSKPEIIEMFAHHPPRGDQASRYNQVRDIIRNAVMELVDLTPESGEQTLAIRDMQRAMMMFNASIALNEP